MDPLGLISSTFLHFSLRAEEVLNTILGSRPIDEKNKRYNFSSLPCTQHLWLPSAPFWSKYRCHSLRIKFKRRNGEKNPELTGAKKPLYICSVFLHFGKSNKLLRRRSCNSNHCGFNSAKLQRLASSSHCNGQDSMSLKMTMCF